MFHVDKKALFATVTSIAFAATLCIAMVNVSPAFANSVAHRVSTQQVVSIHPNTSSGTCQVNSDMCIYYNNGNSYAGFFGYGTWNHDYPHTTKFFTGNWYGDYQYIDGNGNTQCGKFYGGQTYIYLPNVDVYRVVVTDSPYC